MHTYQIDQSMRKHTSGDKFDGYTPKITFAATWNKALELWTYNLVASLTCPGKSAACKDCYAQHGNFVKYDNVAQSIANRTYSTFDLFAFIEGMSDEISRLKRIKGQRELTTFRLHSSGDFWSIDYIYAWYAIARRNPDVQFLAYTRSWRVKSFRVALVTLSRLKNFALRYSVDETMADTSWVRRRPKAYMGTYNGELNCLKLLDKSKSCRDCGLCWQDMKTPAIFSIH